MVEHFCSSVALLRITRLSVGVLGLRRTVSLYPYINPPSYQPWENMSVTAADPGGCRLGGVVSRGYKRGWVRGWGALPLQLGGVGEHCKLPHCPRSFSLLSLRRKKNHHTFSAVFNRNMNNANCAHAHTHYMLFSFCKFKQSH